MIADPAAKLCRYFGTYSEADCLPLRGSFIIDPDEKAKSRYEIPYDGLFAT
jgi:alkyl hydroperoxide reductase subunit AhpC